MIRKIRYLKKYVESRIIYDYSKKKSFSAFDDKKAPNISTDFIELFPSLIQNNKTEIVQQTPGINLLLAFAKV